MWGKCLLIIVAGIISTFGLTTVLVKQLYGKKFAEDTDKPGGSFKLFNVGQDAMIKFYTGFLFLIGILTFFALTRIIPKGTYYEEKD